MLARKRAMSWGVKPIPEAAAAAVGLAAEDSVFPQTSFQPGAHPGKRLPWETFIEHILCVRGNIGPLG